MANGDNPCIPYFDGGGDISAVAEAAVLGRRFVAVSDPQDGSSPAMGLDSTASGGRIKVSHAAAAAKPLGVASYDASIGAPLYVVRGHKVVDVRAGATGVNAGVEVEVGANGTAIPLASGKAVGVALDNIANGSDGPIALY